MCSTSRSCSSAATGHTPGARPTAPAGQLRIREAGGGGGTRGCRVSGAVQQRTSFAWAQQAITLAWMWSQELRGIATQLRCVDPRAGIGAGQADARSNASGSGKQGRPPQRMHHAACITSTGKHILTQLASALLLPEPCNPQFARHRPENVPAGASFVHTRVRTRRRRERSHGNSHHGSSSSDSQHLNTAR
jgi:hypothetical protein